MILGHEWQLAYLNKVVTLGRLSHAYLFYGPKGVGKFTIAKTFAQKLGCAYPLVLDTQHTLVSSKEERKDIPIEDIRELRRISSLAPEGEKWRVAIINEAEKLSPPAADALLKLLEEPGELTLFILVTASPELLPSTIVSRTQSIRFSLLPEKVLAAHLASKKITPSLQKEILWIADGRPGVMFQLLEDRECLEKEKKLIKELSAIIKGREVSRAFDLSGEIAGNEELRSEAISYLLRILREKLPNPLVGMKLKRIQRLATILETTNVNPRLGLDIILLEAIK